MLTEIGWPNPFGQHRDPDFDRNRLGQPISLKLGIPTLTELGLPNTISGNVVIQTLSELVCDLCFVATGGV